MYLSYSPKAFLDEDGKFLDGRLTFFIHDSNVKAEIFTLEGNTYSPAANPQVLNDMGRLDSTIFYDLGIVDVLVEKRHGQAWEQVDHFEIGIDASLEQVGQQFVKDVDELGALDPAVSSTYVTVLSTDGLPQRLYIWDKDSNDTPDGGYVVRSEVVGQGNWILLWFDEVLPASVYGVLNGDASNMNAALTYPKFVGSFRLPTAPIVRIGPGVYDTPLTYVTEKELMFDPGARFTQGEFQCPKARFPGTPTSYYADFVFTSPDFEAHSSWFRSVARFYTSGAKTLVLDGTNFWTDKRITGQVNLDGKILEGGPTPNDLVYSANACFFLTQNTRVPDGYFRPGSDYVRIGAGIFGDQIFMATGVWDPGLISAGHHVLYDQAPDLDLFQNTQRWVSTMTERRARIPFSVWSQTELDLQGRSCQSLRLEAQGFTTIKNANIDSTMLVGYSTTFINVTTTLSVNSSIGAGITLQNCNITIPRYWVTGLTSINSTDSKINVQGAEGINPCKCALSIYGGTWSGYVKMPEADRDAYKLSRQVAFRNVFISGNFKWHLNQVYMAGCTCSCPIDLYPANGGDDIYYYNCTMVNNHFMGDFRLWLTMYYTQEHPHYNVSGTSVKFNTMVILDNIFDNTDPHGIKMLHVHPLSYNTYCCVSNIGDRNMGTWRYSGNKGNCPKMTPGLLNARDNWATEWHGGYAQDSYRKSGSTHYVFMPYYYQHDDATAQEPSRYLDPGDPTQPVLAVYHGRGWSDTWCYTYFWTHMGASLTDEDDNNRLVGYVWISRDKDAGHTPNWHVTGDTGDSEAYTAYTSFILPSQV